MGGEKLQWDLHLRRHLRTAQLDQQLHWHADSNPKSYPTFAHAAESYPTFAHPTNGGLCARDGLQFERMVQRSRLRDMVSSTGTERLLPSTHVQADLSRLAVDGGAAQKVCGSCRILLLGQPPLDQHQSLEY